MTRTPSQARSRFAASASLPAIQARMDQAYAKEREAQRELRWLTGLLIARSRQVAAGLWPPKEETRTEESEATPVD